MRMLHSLPVLLVVGSALLAPGLRAQGTERLPFEDTRKALAWQGRVPAARWAADMQGAMQLPWALQTAGRQDFELMLHPRSRHGPNRQLRAFDAEFQWLRLKKLLSPKRAG